MSIYDNMDWSGMEGVGALGGRLNTGAYTGGYQPVNSGSSFQMPSWTPPVGYKGPSFQLEDLKLPELQPHDIAKMGMQPLVAPPTGDGFWGNMTGIGKVGFGLSALNTFGQLGLGYRAMRAQEDANAHTKNAFNLNFGMKKEQYDRSIRDRAVAHAGAAGLSGAARDAYIAEQAKKVGG